MALLPKVVAKSAVSPQITLNDLKEILKKYRDHWN